jgi:nucleotide-binding universal stress UspA family protein
MRSRRRPHRAALLGSIAEEVCRIAPCPVLVTHSDERALVDGTTRQLRLDRVLVAQDFSDDSELAVRYGVALATTLGGRVDLLHVLPRNGPDQSDGQWSPDAAEQAYHRAAHLLRESVAADPTVDAAIAHAVRWGKPYAEILSYAHEQAVDLVCMGAKGAGQGMWSLFGSNVDRVLRQAPCPLLIVRPLKPSGVAEREVTHSANDRECSDPRPHAQSARRAQSS